MRVLICLTAPDTGQGGSEFELEHVFVNKKLALQHVLQKPMVALEIK